MKLKNKIEKRELIGLRDREGSDIREGDIVEFYYDWKKGSSPVNKNGKYSKMIDVVVIFEGDPAFFCNLGIGAHAWRYNDVCKVIGNIWENPELITSFPEELIEKLFGEQK